MQPISTNFSPPVSPRSALSWETLSPRNFIIASIALGALGCCCVAYLSYRNKKSTSENNALDTKKTANSPPISSSHVQGDLTISASSSAPSYKQRSGYAYKCVGVYDNDPADPSKGKIYQYKLSKKFRAVQVNPDHDPKKAKMEADKANFPAVESPLSNAQRNLPELKKLGYDLSSGEDGIWEIPDAETLMVRWETLRTTEPEKELPELRICTTDGILDDLEFVKKGLKYDCIYSTGKESMHDSLVHVIPTLAKMINYPQYYVQANKRMKGLLREVYKHVKKIHKEHPDSLIVRKMVKVLGVSMDRLLGDPGPSSKESGDRVLRTLNLQKLFDAFSTRKDWHIHYQKLWKEWGFKPLHPGGFLIIWNEFLKQYPMSTS